jgi:hypothetical protein
MDSSRKRYPRTKIRAFRTSTRHIVGIDSLGYEDHFKHLFSTTGVNYSEVTRKHHQRVDKRQATQVIYKKKAERKRKRRKLLYQKMVAGNAAAEESRKEGYDYGPGLMAPKEEDDDEEIIQQIVIGCRACGKSDHKTTHSMKCYYSSNQKSVFFTSKQKEPPLPSVVDSLPPPTPGVAMVASFPGVASEIVEPMAFLPESTYGLRNGK